MNKTHIRAYTKVLQEARSHRQAALEIELSVGMAVMYECAPSKRLGRETLITIYHATGWQCDKPGSIDWRAVNRRISAVIALYDFLQKNDEVTTQIGPLKTTEAVEALRPMVAALKLTSVNEVLIATDRQRPPKRTGHVEGVRIDAGHIHVTIPKSATREDLIALATQLMTMAASEAFVQPAQAVPESHEALAGEPA